MFSFRCAKYNKIMKKIALYTLLIGNLSCFSQVFEVPAGTHPYSDVIEWKGIGTMLMSVDQNTKQVNLTLANNPPEKHNFLYSGNLVCRSFKNDKNKSSVIFCKLYEKISLFVFVLKKPF